jgi:hypothetical protein
MRRDSLYSVCLNTAFMAAELVSPSIARLSSESISPSSVPGRKGVLTTTTTLFSLSPCRKLSRAGRTVRWRMWRAPVHYGVDGAASTGALMTWRAPVHYLVDDVASTGVPYGGGRGKHWCTMWWMTW